MFGQQCQLSLQILVKPFFIGAQSLRQLRRFRRLQLGAHILDRFSQRREYLLGLLVAARGGVARELGNVQPQ